MSAPNAMIAASHPLAAEAGLGALASGGSAADAAVATAAMLTVVEPTGCGIGGDAFAQYWDGVVGTQRLGTLAIRVDGGAFLRHERGAG